MLIWKKISGWIWFVCRYGFRTLWRYERQRATRERLADRAFDSKLDGERLLRHIGATEEQILLAKQKGLA